MRDSSVPACRAVRNSLQVVHMRQLCPSLQSGSKFTTGGSYQRQLCPSLQSGSQFTTGGPHGRQLCPSLQSDSQFTTGGQHVRQLCSSLQSGSQFTTGGTTPDITRRFSAGANLWPVNLYQKVKRCEALETSCITTSLCRRYIVWATDSVVK
jgi:hypothetical protein